MISENDSIAQLWTQLNAVNDHAVDLDLDQDGVAFAFIEQGVLRLAAMKAPKRIADLLDQWGDKVRRGEFDPGRIDNMTPVSTTRN